MKVTIFKSEKESNERCITRFTKVVQGSRKIKDIREGRYRGRKVTKRQVRKAAVMREHYRALRAKNKFYA